MISPSPWLTRTREVSGNIPSVPGANTEMYLSQFLAEYVTVQFRLVTLVARGTLASHSSQHVGRHYSSASYHKVLGAQGSAITTCKPMATQRRAAKTSLLFFSL